MINNQGSTLWDIDPDLVLVGLVWLEDEYAATIKSDDEWTSRLLGARQSLQIAGKIEERRACAIRALLILQEHPKALTRTLLTIQNDVHPRYQQIKADLRDLAVTLNLDTDHVHEFVIMTMLLISPLKKTRHIKIADKGIGGAETTKIENLDLTVKQLVQVFGATVMTFVDIIGTPHPLVIVCGILLIILGFSDAMTKTITERDASVLWGLVVAKRSSHSAGTEAVLAQTNQELAKMGFPPLTYGQVEYSLQHLEELRCIELYGGEWRVIESYTVVEG